jgi:hypothetical protein
MENTGSTIHGTEVIKHSKYFPLDVKPTFTKKWLANGNTKGVINSNFKSYQDAYDDSPTNASCIDSKVGYIYGEGIFDNTGNIDISLYLDEENTEKLILDWEKFGGYAMQIIWNDAKVKAPLKGMHIDINKLLLNIDEKLNVNGYWYSFDYSQQHRYIPVMYPPFTGKFSGNPIEILYVRKATSEPFFPVPSWRSALPYCEAEGAMGNRAKNFFENGADNLTVVNVFDPLLQEEQKEQKATEIKKKTVGTNNSNNLLISFNSSQEAKTTFDRVEPPQLNENSVFFSEECERKIIVAHKISAILVVATSGNSFSSNADEIAMATKMAFQKEIQPNRKKILVGFDKFAKAINPLSKIDFLDIEIEKETDITESE